MPRTLEENTSLGDEDEAEPYYQDVPNPTDEVEAVEEVSEEGEEPEEGGDKDPVTREELNRLAYQLRTERRDKEVMEKRFEQLLEWRNEQVNKPAPAQRRPLPDPDENFGDHVVERFNRLEATLGHENDRRAYEQQVKEYQSKIQNAYVNVQQFRSEVGEEEYDAAVGYLVEKSQAEMKLEYDDMTDKEINEVLSQQILARFLEWDEKGKNPGKQMYELAKTRGYSEAPRAAERETDEDEGIPQDKVKREVKLEKKRQNKASTIGTSRGTAPKTRISTKRALEMSEDEWENQFRGVSFAEIMRSKERN
jgi:hypothetical protein